MGFQGIRSVREVLTLILHVDLMLYDEKSKEIRVKHTEGKISLFMVVGVWC